MVFLLAPGMGPGSSSATDRRDGPSIPGTDMNAPAPPAASATFAVAPPLVPAPAMAISSSSAAVVLQRRVGPPPGGALPPAISITQAPAVLRI
jgi:hypothetical protein